MIRKVLLLFFSCIALFSVQAQDHFWDKTSWTIGLVSHSVSLPFKDVFKKPLNLGIVLGAEYTYKQNKVNSWHQRLELGWYHHKELNTAFWAKTDIISRFTAENGLYVDIQVGLGYMYDIPAYKTFKVENGEVIRPKIGGKGALISDFGIGGGYNINIKNNRIVTPFVKYESIFQFPYSDFVPVFPHSLLHVGSRFKL